MAAQNMFRLRSLFWKIFFAFWLASVFVLFATIFSALKMTESQRLLDRHADAVLRVAGQFIYQYEHGQQPELKSEHTSEPGAAPATAAHHNRRHRFGRAGNLLIYGPDGELLFGKPEKHKNHRNHIDFALTGGSGQLYKIISHRPPPPRFVLNWLARMRSVSIVFILLAAALVSAGLSWMITRPLRSLGEHARDLAAGDFNTPLNAKLLRRGDEIGELAREFDRMGNKVGEMIESRQQLLHDVSHELRAPLARLQAAAALNQQRGASLDQATLQRVEQECERMDTLIRQILDYARLDQDEELDEYIELNSLLAALVDDVRLEYATHPLSLTLPQEIITVHGNGDLLRRALENVLRNACKHTPAGTAVDTCLERSTAAISICMRDHGPGIGGQELDDLVKPFYRAGHKMHGDGFGLGLSIAARAVEKHGGTLRVVNHPHDGLEVTVTLDESVCRL